MSFQKFYRLQPNTAQIKEGYQESLKIRSLRLFRPNGRDWFAADSGQAPSGQAECMQHSIDWLTAFV